ncbi:MAG: DUF4173 domain-containing protein, partial [Bacteroidota bacterium]
MHQLRSTIQPLPMVLAMAFVFHWLFWEEGMGLNLLLFNALMGALLWFLYPEAFKKIQTKGVLLGTMFTGAMVIWHNSGVSKVINFASLTLLAGFCQNIQLRSVPFALAQSGLGLIQVPLSFRREINKLSIGPWWLKKSLSYLKLIGIPLSALAVFAAIFLIANPRFSALTQEYLGHLGEWIAQWSAGSFFFWCLGVLVMGGLLLNHRREKLSQREAGQRDQLLRTRRQHRVNFPLLALKNEYRTGLMLMLSVNLLLLVNNLIDIDWIWINFEPGPEIDLTQFVHEGTYLLIISILLSMGIMLYYFRGNLNFYSRSRWLKGLSYAWILQNVILVVSVALRNYHYIAEGGLAYKRIGVFFFLALVVFGLFTLWLKIRDRMSTYYLFRVNAWAVYGIAMLLSSVNWDRVITDYNLIHSQPNQL